MRLPFARKRNTEHIEEPSQILALFNAFPGIDTARLTQHVNAMEAGQAQCSATEFETGQRTDKKRVGTGLVSFPNCNVAVIIHEWPMPEDTTRTTIEASHWSPAVKAELSKHTSYALCTGVGLARPIEKLIALYKIGLGLIDQGAVAIANEQTWSCYPAEVFEILRQQGIWDSLRQEGAPAELVTGFVKAEIDGQLWFLSKGHAMFGLPELAHKAEGGPQASKWRGIFNNIFYYLFEHGPILGIGHTMEIAGGTYLRFSKPSARQRFSTNRRQILIVTEE